MNRLRDLLSENMNEGLDHVVISRPRDKGNPITKIKIRPVLIKDRLMFQETAYNGPKVLHSNHDKADTIDRIMELMKKDYIQIEAMSSCLSAVGLVNRKGGVSLKVKNIKKDSNIPIVPRHSLKHNRTKNYILKEGVPVGFLVDLGLMTDDGRIIRAGYDKYKQINRFLEFIEDITDKLPVDREVRILDFGCGKSYLTFAVYYYLKELRGINVRITGLDLKEDVINTCSRLKDKYGYEKLTFLCGDVATYEPDGGIDLVMTLHACDTATDYALYNAVKWGAKVILSVPCCQHEVAGQITSALLQPVMKYGIIKERMSALITDGFRAELIRACGYDVQLLEFIDMEHTPKNILIRAVRSDKATGSGQLADISDLQQNGLYGMLLEMGINPMLYRLLLKTDV